MKSIIKSVGRPSKLTPKTIKILKGTIGKGMSYADACTLQEYLIQRLRNGSKKQRQELKNIYFFLMN